MGRRTRGAEARLLAGQVVPPEDRAWFVRENAVALLAERDELIERLRKDLTRISQAAQSRRQEIVRLRKELETASYAAQYRLQEIVRLHSIIDGMAARIAAQSELLTQRAEVPPGV